MLSPVQNFQLDDEDLINDIAKNCMDEMYIFNKRLDVREENFNNVKYYLGINNNEKGNDEKFKTLIE